MKKDKRTKGQKDKWTFVLSICPFVLLSFILCSCGGGNLALLQSGQELFYQEDFQKSDAKFEEFNKQNESPTQTSIAAEAATLVGGARTNDYKPYMMDELFASYYQLLDALALGDFDTARVIINQSYARQQKFSSEYASLVKERSKDQGKRAKEIESASSSEYSQWRAYSDIMNPALTYLAGLYFLNTAADNSDWENARVYLLRASGMMPDNGFIKQDLDLAQRRIRPSGAEWTIIETGAAPKLVQEKMTLPWLIGKGP
ncbi:MAG: hypothetical protein LBJ18_04415, partial [Rickettsiales bacterium]|nr:hypothetical protein [Rickettsiales bacterium]